MSAEEDKIATGDEKQESSAENLQSEETKVDNQPKRRRGRPRKKADSEKEEEEEVKKPTRKRSRPKKKAATSSDGEDASDESSSTKPGNGSKRGRPKKRIRSSKKEEDEESTKKKVKPPKKKLKKGEIDFDNLKSHTVAELRDYCEKENVKVDSYVSGTPRKIELINAIQQHRKGEAPMEEEDEGPKWDVWKQIYLVGTEWHNYDSVFDVDWDFSHLQEGLEEDGELYNVGTKHPVYLFGVTERNSSLIPKRVIFLPICFPSPLASDLWFNCIYCRH